MNPIRFGTDAREMVGFYHAAQQDPRAPGVLICNPFGPEAIRSYRMLRLLADRLAAAGCAVLRFDYYGTGDSAGDDDSASLAAWAGDIGVAHRELLTRCGKANVVWIGLRLGASLCTFAAQSARPNLKHLVLWDPILYGSEYLEVFRSARSAGSVTPLYETMGFEFPERFCNELRALNLASTGPVKVPRATLIVGADNEESQRLRSSLASSQASADTSIDWTVSHTVNEWNSEKALNSAVIPMQLLQLIESKVMEPAK